MSPMIKLPLTLEHALLGYLRQQPMHAYEMYQRLEQAQALGLVWHLKQSQLYALLARLEEAGYIVATTEPQGNRPPRRMLHLTTDGSAAFDRWLRAPVTHGRDFRQEFIAKLFFAEREGADRVLQLIADQRRECLGWLDDVRKQAGRLSEDRTFDWLVFQFRISNLEAILDWLDTCRARLHVAAPS